MSLLTGVTTQVCSLCSTNKPLEDYTKHRARRLGRDSRCKPCKAASQVASRYGLTLDEYLEMLDSQGHVCAICGEPETVPYRDKVRSLAVDHNHDTGEVRALLCTRCNRLIGVARERVEILQAAIDYLDRESWTGRYVPEVSGDSCGQVHGTN